MGRIEKSKSLAPPAVRKDMRAKQARQIVNRVVPAVLASNARARKGVESSELIVDPQAGGGSMIGVIGSQEKERDGGRKDGGARSEDGGLGYVKRKGQGRRKIKSRDDGGETVGLRDDRDESGVRGGRKKDLDKMVSMSDSMANVTMEDTPTKQRRIRIMVTDSLTAAHMLTFPSKYPSSSTSTATIPPTKSIKKNPNICVLNMASPLRPGGGILTGATSQEEFLCARTTLLPSLKESFYRLPELGGIFTHDVLVIRSSLPLGNNSSDAADILPTERWYIDVISAAALRFPELEGGHEEDDDEDKKLSQKDRQMAKEKMRAVLRIAMAKGVRKMVLGAWGCGAYGNPVRDVARAWRKVLDGCVSSSSSNNTSSFSFSSSNGKNKKTANKAEVETWPALEEVVFAISTRSMAERFADAFGGDVHVEIGPRHLGVEEEDGDEGADRVAEELRTKIAEMQTQLGSVWNPSLKLRMQDILAQLQVQLIEREGGGSEHGSDEEDGDSELSEEDATR